MKDPGVLCGNCRYYEAVVETPAGVCRRYPPQMMTAVSAHWRHVSNEDWCGEFQAVQAAQKAPEPPAERPGMRFVGDKEHAARVDPREAQRALPASPRDKKKGKR